MKINQFAKWASASKIRINFFSMCQKKLISLYFNIHVCADNQGFIKRTGLHLNAKRKYDLNGCLFVLDIIHV